MLFTGAPILKTIKKVYMSFKPNKNKLKDSGGRPLTQGLFLEVGYNYDTAVYSLKDEDHETDEGKVYPSLKRLYLELEDPTEYAFATQYLAGWGQWKRILNNKNLRKHVDEWREELELKLRSQAVQDIIQMSADEKGFQAARWLADRGWEKKGAGRPKKDTSEHDSKMQKRLEDEFSADIVRLSKV